MKSNIIVVDLNTNINDLNESIEANDGLPRYFRVDTSKHSGPNHDLMRISLRNDSAKKILVDLTKLGFYTYWNTDGQTRLVRHDRVVHHWGAIKDGTYQTTDDGIVYSFSPAINAPLRKLLVIFSPLSSKPRLSRFFVQSFSKVQKFLAPGTAILRIADIGGVKGAFYLDTNFAPDNSANIANFIHQYVSDLGLHREDVVLYGASKGGTASVYHGLSNSWPFVAVDPILGDLWYEVNENDYHFTATGIFPQTKEQVFHDLLSSDYVTANGDATVSTVITAMNSPQRETVLSTLQPVAGRLRILDSDNDAITSHPDVAPNTIYAQIMVINSMLLGMEMRRTNVSIP